jgi:hypothetical protein
LHSVSNDAHHSHMQEKEEEIFRLQGLLECQSKDFGKAKDVLDARIAKRDNTISKGKHLLEEKEGTIRSIQSDLKAALEEKGNLERKVTRMEKDMLWLKKEESKLRGEEEAKVRAKGDISNEISNLKCEIVKLAEEKRVFMDKYEKLLKSTSIEEKDRGYADILRRTENELAKCKDEITTLTLVKGR